MVFGRTTLGGLVASALLVANSWAAPDVSQPEKRQSSPFAITGVTGTGNQPRLELRTLQENTDLFNIYILGLSRMQTTDQSDYLSWFQLAGELCPPFDVGTCMLILLLKVSTACRCKTGMA